MTAVRLTDTKVLPCTCHAPVAVDLTQSSTSTTAPNSCSRNAKTLLKTNLQTCGWSHVLIDIPYKPPTQSQIFNLFEKKKKLTQGCPSPTTRTPAATVAAAATTTTASEDDTSIKQLKANFPSHVQYHTAESGGEMIIEPKESLEISTANINRNDDDSEDAFAASSSSPSSSEYKSIESWCNAMYTIAKHVRHVLDLPSHVLLYENDDNDTSRDCDNGKNGKIIDLMRVFYYHRVVQREASTTTPIVLGSSPHTDWGSFTIVWQDDVGGLVGITFV